MVGNTEQLYRIVKPVNGKWGVKWNKKLDYNFMPKQVFRDNKNVYNVRGGDGVYTSIRVPSLKRSDRVWRKFYNLFPSLKGETSYRGYKLKKLKDDK